MNNKLRNIFFEDNRKSIEKIVDFTIKHSQQYKMMADEYLEYKSSGYQAYKSIGNINLNYEDIRQQLFLELFEMLERIDFVNLKYVKLLCESRLKNILRRYFLERKIRAQGVVFEELEVECFLSSLEMVYSEIVVQEVINDTLLQLVDPLEKKYLKVLAGNLGIASYEKYAFYNTNKSEPDDLCIAKLLGFDSIFQRKYRRIKNKVRKTLYSVIKSYDDVA